MQKEAEAGAMPPQAEDTRGPGKVAEARKDSVLEPWERTQPCGYV